MPLDLARGCAPLAAALLACGGPPATTTEGSTTSGSSTTEVAPSSSSTTGLTDPTTGAASTSTGFEPPTPVCGNGYLEAGEECDDANLEDGDSCDHTCKIPCGLEAEVVALAPSAESELWGVAVAAAPDGGVLVVARQREVTSDQDGNLTVGKIRTRALRYGVDLAPLWDVLLAPDDVDLVPNAAVADAAGDVYLTGTVAGQDGDDIFVARLAAADGSLVWSLTHDGAADASDDLGRGVALTADGEVVVVGRVSDTDMDSDVWVRKLAASDGAEIWTSTWGGAGNGQFSIDDASDVAVALDGSIYVGAAEYVDFNHSEATLLRFAAAGGKALWSLAPIDDPISPHIHDPGLVAASPTGEALFVVRRTNGAVEPFWAVKVGADKQVLWTREVGDFQDDGDEWALRGGGFSAAGDLALAGSYRLKDPMAQLEWTEAWVARLSPEGERRCLIHYDVPSDDLLPPSLTILAGALDPERRVLVTGQLVVGDEQQLWLGLFRPD